MVITGSRTFLEVASMVVTWWIVAFLCSNYVQGGDQGGIYAHSQGLKSDTKVLSYVHIGVSA